MNALVKDNTQNEEFDIQEKLKRSGSCWSYMRLAQPFQAGFNYEFITKLLVNIEFAIYERVGDYFFLVDFFENYEDASEQAKDILNAYTDFKKNVTGGYTDLTRQQNVDGE